MDMAPSAADPVQISAEADIARVPEAEDQAQAAADHEAEDPGQAGEGEDLAQAGSAAEDEAGAAEDHDMQDAEDDGDADWDGAMSDQDILEAAPPAEQGKIKKYFEMQKLIVARLVSYGCRPVKFIFV